MSGFNTALLERPVQQDEWEVVKPRAIVAARRPFDEDDESASQMLRIWADDWDSEEDQSNRIR